MAENTSIEWADDTHNEWIGCTKVSTSATCGGGCDNCYAEQSTPVRVLRAHGIETWGSGAQRHLTSESNRRKPLQWAKREFVQCTSCGWRGELSKAEVRDYPGESAHHCPECEKTALRKARRRVFSASLSDWLDNAVPIEWVVGLLDTIRRTPELDWLLLSKRIGNWRKRLEEARSKATGWLRDWVIEWLGGKPPANVWLGATVVNQDEADRDVPKLLAVPACIRFLSVEPMLGPVDLTDITLRRGTGDEEHFDALHFDGDADDEPEQGTATLDWVIAGGESGPKARPAHPDWFRSLRDQCAAAGVPFMHKQWGEWAPWEPRHPVSGVRHLSARDGAWGTSPRLVAYDGSVDGYEARADTAPMVRIGKKAAGRLLDGRTHDGFPSEVQA